MEALAQSNEGTELIKSAKNLKGFKKQDKNQDKKTATKNLKMKNK